MLKVTRKFRGVNSAKQMKDRDKNAVQKTIKTDFEN
jgi:hypothetical protein